MSTLDIEIPAAMNTLEQSMLMNTERQIQLQSVDNTPDDATPVDMTSVVIQHENSLMAELDGNVSKYANQVIKIIFI